MRLFYCPNDEIGILIEKDGYKIKGVPNRIEYQKNENGLFTVDIKDFVAEDRNGQKRNAFIRIPNAKVPVGDDEGVIDLHINDIEPFGEENETNESAIFSYIFSNEVINSEV